MAFRVSFSDLRRCEREERVIAASTSTYPDVMMEAEEAVEGEGVVLAAQRAGGGMYVCDEQRARVLEGYRIGARSMSLVAYQFQLRGRCKSMHRVSSCPFVVTPSRQQREGTVEI
jgi:hypothetical protein